MGNLHHMYLFQTNLNYLDPLIRRYKEKTLEKSTRKDALDKNYVDAKKRDIHTLQL